LQDVEERLKEAEAGVEEWREKVKTLQEKEDARALGEDDEVRFFPSLPSLLPPLLPSLLL